MGERGGAVFGVLVGTALLAGGIAAGYFSLRPLAQARAMKAWRAVPASVLSCELSTSRSSKGGTSYQAQAAYRYRVDGVEYTGTRVSLHAGHDNIGQFQRRTFEALNRCRASGQPTTCWVDPRAPSNAILVRRPRFELLVVFQVFVLAFGGTGLFVLSACLAALVRPGASMPDGSAGQGQLRMRGAGAHRVAGALAAAANGYAGWFLWQACGASAPEPLPCWLWLFALVGVLPAAVAGYLIGRYRKYGVSVLEVSPLPGAVGGTVGGTLRIPARVDAPDGFEITFQCVHQYTTGSGKNASRHREVLWQDTQRVAEAYAFGDESMLPLRIAVPGGLPATTAQGGANGHYWQLKASAATPGIDYKAVFDVPMRRSAALEAPRSPLSMPAQALASETRGASGGEIAALAGLLLEARPGGGFVLTFPAGLARSAVASLAVFGAVWTAACVLLWTVAKAPVAIALVFALLDAIVLLMLVNVLFVTRGIAVDPAARSCAVWWRAPGLRTREQRVPFEAVVDIRCERAGSSGNTQYYRIVLDKGAGVPLTVGSGLTMWSAAEGVARLLRASLAPGFSLGGSRA